MKRLIQGLGVGALLLTSACYVPAYGAHVTYRSYGGYGGSGVDTLTAADQCRRQAYARGWRYLREEYVDVTGPYTVRFRFLADGPVPFRSSITCYYDGRTNIAQIR
ncbi:MAG TPA: hypothetical protein VIG99_32540 [Myxococcaceae bacterium]|jgi:hypothetical protein